MQEILNVFGIKWELLLIQAFNFALMLLVLYKFVYKPLFKVVEKREKKIKDSIAQAEAVEIMMKDTEEKRKEILSQAAKKADKIYKNEKKEAILIKQKAEIEAEHILEETTNQAKVQAEIEKERILKDAEKELVKTSVLLAEKILKKENE